MYVLTSMQRASITFVFDLYTLNGICSYIAVWEIALLTWRLLAQ